MHETHDVQSVTFSGPTLILQVDGKQYKIDIRKQSKRLAKATQQQRENFEVSPAGYGIHWPDVDEDLSIDGLIGVKHAYPLIESKV
ncbi:MAG: hypothetical protein EWM72_03395 [Nitrospira sp.]|nr:MAG: hypothetical protein EWM72_03395 [Nitrospira sp.]